MTIPTKVKTYFCRDIQLEIAGGARQFHGETATKKRWSASC
jgi:hypothetical protein